MRSCRGRYFASEPVAVVHAGKPQVGMIVITGDNSRCFHLPGLHMQTGDRDANIAGWRYLILRAGGKAPIVACRHRQSNIAL